MANSLVYKGFKDLDCWKKGRELRIKISVPVKLFPSEEKYMLTSQIIRSSRSVANNIAEGYGRYTYRHETLFYSGERFRYRNN